MRRLTSTILLIGAVAVGGCAPNDSTPAPVTVTTVTVTPSSTSVRSAAAPQSAPTSGSRAQDAPLASAFTQWAEGAPGQVAVTVAAVGSDTTATLLPASDTDVAWSTIKAPLALAVARDGVPGMSSSIEAALTQSDNSAAEELWGSLGPPSTAADRVGDILRDGGDTATVVQSQRLRPGFTAFGQTRWSLPAQARWMAGLPCLPDADAVLDPMRRVISSQQWGLGIADSAAIKGGWGPDPSGTYLVRQMGILTNGRGSTAIAISARANDGTFASGTQLMTSVARWLVARQDRLPTGKCG